MKKYTLLPIIFLIFISSAHAANDRKGLTRDIGDITQIVPFATSFAATRRLHDDKGRNQLLYSCAATQILAEVGKRTFKSRRPDGSDTKSFPSGHTSMSFCGASFIHQRYGFKEAWPLYIISGYTGYSRMWANRHRFIDVFGAAVLSYVVSKHMVDPYEGSMSLTGSDYAWGTAFPLVFDRIVRKRNIFDTDRYKITSDSIMLAEGLNFIAKDYLPSNKKYNFETRFTPIQGNGIGLQFKISF